MMRPDKFEGVQDMIDDAQQKKNQDKRFKIHPMDTLCENGWYIQDEEIDHYGDHIYCICHESDVKTSIQVRVLERDINDKQY